MRFHRMLKGEEGFSLAELLVAGLIIAVALLPMIRIFDTTFHGIFSYERIHQGANCARAAVERVRSLPFYVPYNEAEGDRDIDDFFWGNRVPIGYNPSTTLPEGGYSPNWDLIPEVTYYDYGQFPGYENYKVTVQLSYLNSDTGVADMFPEWGPKTPGNDQPRNADNELLHLLLVRVNVYWPPGTSEHVYSLEQVVTDTQTVYNMGISRVVVTGPQEVMDPERENAAAHYPDVTVKLDIYGYGFKPGEGLNKPKGMQAYLVRFKYKDITINLKRPSLRSGPGWAETWKDESQLIAVLLDADGKVLYERVEGELVLYNTGTSNVPGEPNFYPRAAVGYWSVRVAQEEIINSYLFNGFIVEYPRPTVTQFGNDPDMGKTGKNDESAKQLKILGKNFITKVKNPTPVLIQYDQDNNVISEITGTVNSISGTVNYGYSDSTQTMLATFDLTKGLPGDYRLVVYNTDPGVIGHVGSIPSTDVYTVQAVPPVVTDVYVSGTSPRLRVAYKNVDFGKVRLAIEGNYFNPLDPELAVYISDSVSGDPLTGSYAQGSIVEKGLTRIVADFDVTQLPAKDNSYNAFVKSRGLWGYITTPSPRLSVRTFSGNIDSFSITGTTGFWENYYDIPSMITGSGLNAAIDVTIARGGTEFGDIEYSVVDASRIDVSLNLIDCAPGAWELRVYITPTYYLKKTFTVTQGKAVILGVQSVPMYALYIDRRRAGTQGYTTDYEYGTHVPVAYNSTNQTTWEARFRVRGMGFPTSGTTTLRVWYQYYGEVRWAGVQGDYVALTDRTKKRVWIESDWWTMPNNDGYCEISVQRTGDPTNPPDVHYNRWRLD